MGGIVLLTSFNTCSSFPFTLPKTIQLKMINLLSLRSNTSEERKKSNQMQILKLPNVVLMLTTFHSGISATYQHLAL